MRIFWQDSMALGVPTLDAEHRQLVSLLDSFCVILRYRNLEAAGRAFREFSQAALAHLANEEQLIAQFAHDGAERHLDVHGRTREVIGRLGAAIFDHRDLAAAERLAGEIISTWIRALLSEDVVLAARLKRAVRAQ